MSQEFCHEMPVPYDAVILRDAKDEAEFYQDIAHDLLKNWPEEEFKFGGLPSLDYCINITVMNFI